MTNRMEIYAILIIVQTTNRHGLTLGSYNKCGEIKENIHFWIRQNWYFMYPEEFTMYQMFRNIMCISNENSPNYQPNTSKA